MGRAAFFARIASRTRRSLERFFATAERRRMAREGVWVFAGQIGVALAGLASVRIFTGLALPRDYGEANLVVIALMLGRQVFVAPFSNSQLRHHVEFAHAGLANWYTREIAALTWRASAACALACALFFFIWSHLKGGPFRWGLLAALMAMLAMETPKNVRVVRMNAERRQARYALWSSAEAWLILILSVPILYYWRTAEALLFGQVAGSLVVVLTLGMLFAPKPPADSAQPAPGEHATMLKKTLRYGLPFVPVAIFGWLAGQSDRFVLDWLKSAADVGLYASSAQIASKPMTMISGFLATLLTQILFAAENVGDTRKARRVFHLWLLAAAAIAGSVCVVFFFGGNALANILLGPKYREGAGAMMFWVSLGFAFVPVTQAIETRLLSIGYTKGLIIPQAAAAVSLLSLTFLLVPTHAALGVAQARAASNCVQCAVVALSLLRAKYNRKNPRGPAPAVKATADAASKN